MQLMSSLTTVNQMFGHFSLRFLLLYFGSVARAKARACRIRSGEEAKMYTISVYARHTADYCIGRTHDALNEVKITIQCLYGGWRCARCSVGDLSANRGEEKSISIFQFKFKFPLIKFLIISALIQAQPIICIVDTDRSARARNIITNRFTGCWRMTAHEWANANDELTRETEKECKNLRDCEFAQRYGAHSCWSHHVERITFFVYSFSNLLTTSQ